MAPRPTATARAAPRRRPPATDRGRSGCGRPAGRASTRWTPNAVRAAATARAARQSGRWRGRPRRRGGSRPSRRNAGGERVVAAVLAARRSLDAGADAAPRLVARPRDGAGGSHDAGHEDVCVASPRAAATASCSSRHRMSSLGRGDRRCSSTRAQGGRRRRAGAPRGRRAAARLRERPPTRGLDVAQPTPALLQVGLEQIGDLAVLVVAAPHRRRQSSVEPTLRPALPLRSRPPARRSVSSDRRQGGGPTATSRVSRSSSEGQGLLDRAHRVPQLRACVPDRIPEALGHVGHAPVACRAGAAGRGRCGARANAAPVPPHGDQGDRGGRARRPPPRRSASSPSTSRGPAGPARHHGATDARLAADDTVEWMASRRVASAPTTPSRPPAACASCSRRSRRRGRRGDSRP